MKKSTIFGAAVLIVLGLLAGCSEDPSPEMTSFSINSTVGVIDDDTGYIVLAMAQDTDYDCTSLTADFIYTGDSVTVDGVSQTSGSTTQDFTDTVKYVVTSGSSSKTYYVTVYLTGATKLVFSEYFNEEGDEEDDADYLGDFFQYSLEGESVWSYATYGDDEYAYITGYYDDEPANNDWLITSSAVDLSGYGSAYLSFDSCMNYDDDDSYVSVIVSTDYISGENPENYTWTDLTDEASWSSGDWSWADSGLVSLSDYSGDEVFIAFQYISTASDQDTWEIDNVEVYAELDS
ncbi:MAG: choice-of-anchor J domain-containing protein [Spirochaetales bacterium]|nr:choice-of-anchor J domain-containing protein [Spirochaetales bacterium]